MSRKIFRLLSRAFMAVLLILIAIFVLGRLRGASAEQQAALDLLAEKPTYKIEENLAPYLWLISYDVPEDQIQTIARLDAEKFNTLRNIEAIAEFKTRADGLFPYVGYLEEELSGYCKPDNPIGCVEQVESGLRELRPLLRANQKMIARAERIKTFRVHYSPMELHIESPLPKFNAGRELLLVHYADLFLEGQQETAVGKVCDDIALWRSIGANSDSLIGSMIGHAYIRTDMRLMAEMLGRMELGAALPESCALAFAKVDYKENMICEPLRGEFGITKNLDVSLVDEPRDSGRFGYQFAAMLTYDHEQTVRNAAPFFASSCSVEAANAAKRNEPIQLNAASEYKCDPLGWVSNFAGCNLLEFAAPDYGKYSGRRIDQMTQITAMQTWLWLREKKATSDNIEKSFAARPANLKEFSNRIKLDIKTGVMKVSLLSPANDGKATWSLPLHPAMTEN